MGIALRRADRLPRPHWRQSMSRRVRQLMFPICAVTSGGVGLAPNQKYGIAPAPRGPNSNGQFAISALSIVLIYDSSPELVPNSAIQQSSLLHPPRSTTIITLRRNHITWIKWKTPHVNEDPIQMFFSRCPGGPLAAGGPSRSCSRSAPRDRNARLSL